ncbi:MAG: TolC family protein [Dechloromonas sp.]|nr:TolC family protein [Dechloromonas sp.]
MNQHLPRLFKATLLSGLVAALGLPALASAEALPVVVERVLLQQPSVRSAQALLNAAESQVSQVRSDYLPTASLGYRNSRSRDETQGVPFDRTVRRSDATLRWNLFNGGADFYRLRSIKLSRDAAETDLDEVLERVAAEITESYADVVRLRQTINSLDDTITRQERLKQLVVSRVDAGRIPPAELDQVSVRLIQSRTLLGQLRTQLATAEYRYRLLTGVPPENLVLPAIALSSTDVSASQLIERLHERNPRLRAALQRVSARQADVGAARGSFMPSVDLEVTKRLNNNTNPVPVTDSDHGNLLRVNLDIPLGGRNLARHNETIERYKAAQADADQLSNDLSREVTDIHGQLEEMARIDSLLEQRVRSAQRVAAAYELHFEAGRRSLNDVSISQDDLFEAQRNLVETRARQTVIQARLLSMAGELREALQTRYRAAPIAPELLRSEPAEPASVLFARTPAGDGSVNATPPSPTPLAEVEARLAQWAAAWADKKYETYRSFYTADYQPADRRSTTEWEAERQRRISQAISPSIRIESLKADATDDNRVSSRFVQHYKAENFSDTVLKQINWARINGEWKIVSETVRQPMPAKSVSAP